MILDHFFYWGTQQVEALVVRGLHVVVAAPGDRGYSCLSCPSDDQTPVWRRRDTVTITTGEIGKFFDAFNTVSAQLKLQGQALESVKNSLQDF